MIDFYANLEILLPVVAYVYRGKPRRVRLVVCSEAHMI